MPAPALPAPATFPNGKPMVDAQGRPASPKSRLAAVLLAWFFGVLGVHRFYVGKVGTGILMILTLGGLGIWVLVDMIMILVGSFKDKQGRYLSNW
jgi:TM2 domain-containing membrane protein YozV